MKKTLFLLVLTFLTTFSFAFEREAKAEMSDIRGDIKTMSLESIRRYIEAVGGTLTLIAELPTGTVKLT